MNTSIAPKNRSTFTDDTHRFLPFVAILCSLFVVPVSAQQYQVADLYKLQDTPAHFIGDYFVTNAAFGQVVALREDVGPVFFSAALWTPPNGAYRNLGNFQNLEFDMSEAFGTNGVQQVGYASTQSGFGEHAASWSGTAGSMVDLNPSQLGFNISMALGIFGTQQVGMASVTETSTGLVNSHAILWNGTAASAVDLHPTNLAGFTSSTAQGSDGIHQVGYGILGTGASHAVLWNGAAGSAVDLHPTNLAGFDFSQALGVGGAQQVGYGGGSGTGGKNRALLWSGTAASAADLHPLGLSAFDSSTARGTNGIYQVGSVYNSATFVGHAALWSGTANSFFDLATLLPFQATDSTAYTIDSQSNVWGTATDSTGTIHAIEWSLVPEPATWALFAAGAAGLLAFRRLSC